MCKIQIDDNGEPFVVLPEAIWKELESDDWRVGDELGYEPDKGKIRVVNLSRQQRLNVHV
ncbi:hypothetical protein [Agarilytica rhodophyticola]|uniref:hypothetical protein n=1 Tax=Agarilytica rhodophyticola TaxID=1737490 RepID=UPI000CD8DDB1|nr:hypothetical protein [Agarilytica rhodophyticola]